MLGWLRRWFPARTVTPAARRAAVPFRWPEKAQQLSRWADLAATHRRERAVVFISVRWSVQERRSRRTFAELIGRITRGHPELGVWFGVLSEHSEGADRWFKALALPAAAATGYGAVVWLQRGRVLGLVPYAAKAGTEELVRHTVQLWGRSEPGAAAGTGAFDRVKALGALPPSHAQRVRFLATADRSVIGTIRLGVLFIMAFWSGPSRQGFARLKQVLAAADPGGRLEVVVVDTDGCPDLYEAPEFAGKLHGSGEVAWVKDGRVVFTSGVGYHPECFEPLTRQLLSSASDAGAGAGADRPC